MMPLVSRKPSGLGQTRGRPMAGAPASAAVTVSATPSTTFVFSLDDMPTTPKFVTRSRERSEDHEAGVHALSPKQLERALHTSVRTPARLRLGGRGDSAANLAFAALEIDETGEGVVARRWREWRGGAGAAADSAWDRCAADTAVISEGQLDALIEELATRKTRSAPLGRTLDALEKELRVKDTAQRPQNRRFGRMYTSSNLQRDQSREPITPRSRRSGA